MAISPALDSLLVALLLVATSVAAWRDRGDGRDAGDPLDEAREAYATGEISLEEYERRATLALDDRAKDLRADVEEVGGVGPDTSAALALRFGSLDGLRRADRADLMDVHGVGPSTADAIRERYGR